MPRNKIIDKKNRTYLKVNKKIAALIKKFKLKIGICENLDGASLYLGNKFIVLGNNWDTMSLLHEIGHYFCEEIQCCTEHSEFMAHASALTLAKIFNIKLPKNKYWYLSTWAGKSPHSKCKLYRATHKKGAK
jgi:hypothetical protein